MSSSDEVGYRAAYETALGQCLLLLGTHPPDGVGEASRRRVVLALAIGMLMQAGDCDEDAAARTLARAAARSEETVDQFAEYLVEIQNDRSR